jgi:hypothetical protein
MLHFSIIAGRNLTVRDRNGTAAVCVCVCAPLALTGVSTSGLSDPFCRAAVYDSKKKAGKGYQTPIIKKTLNPVWKNPEVLTMYAAIRSLITLHYIYISMYPGRLTRGQTARALPCRSWTTTWWPATHSW